MKRLPGPSTMISASSMALRTSAGGLASLGSSQILRMSLPCSLMASSPLILSPPESSATRVTDSVVTGRTLPLMARRLFISSTARRKSPSCSEVASGLRLPRLWPASSPLSPELKESFQRIVVLRKGNNTVSYTRPRGQDAPSLSLPGTPPSSVTVTTATILRVKLFSPRSSVERPVPPRGRQRGVPWRVCTPPPLKKPLFSP